MSVSRWENYTVLPSGCWKWEGYADSNGYGRVYVPEKPKGQQVQWAHRAFYEHHVAPIPAGFDIDHTCCNTLCVNPAHLDAVTRAEHVRRTLARLGKDDLHLQAAELRALRLTYAEIADVLGYVGKGSAHTAVLAAITKGLVEPDSVPEVDHLSEADRDDIRALHALGIPQRELVAWYGVDSSHISRICNYRDRKGKAA